MWANAPDGMNGQLLLLEGKEGIVDEGAPNFLGGLGELPVKLLDVVAAAHAGELQYRLVVLEIQDGLVAYKLVSAAPNGSSRSSLGWLTVVGHDQIDLRLLHGTAPEVRP